MSLYVYIEGDVVQTEPATLPKSWKNISNLPAMSDNELWEIGWYPANVIIPEYDTYYEYLSGYTYLMHADYVDATMVVHTITPPPLPPVDGEAKAEALDVAKQGENIWVQDRSRRDVGAVPIIPDADKAVWDDWMRSNYEAMDSGQPPVEPPAQVRRVIDMPDQSEGQCVIQWHQFTGTWAGWGFKAVFKREDTTSLGLKVYDENGGYLYALTFEANGTEGEWITETPAGFATPTKVARSFEIIAGSAPVTEYITLDSSVEYRSFMVKWKADETAKIKKDKKVK